MSPPKARKIPFPVQGLHEGVGYDIQPPGTTPDALNVRGYDAIENRLRGGRRPGTSKWFSDQINGSETIQAMAKTVEGTAYQSEDEDFGPTIEIDDNFSTQTQAIPTYLGDDWVTARVSERGGASGTQGPADSSEATLGVDANGLVLDSWDTSTLSERYYVLLASRWRGPNKATAHLRCRPQASSDNNGTGVADDCQCFGPFIRGNTSLSEFVFACLIRTGADQVRLQIIHKGDMDNSGDETLLAQSSDITLSGDSGVVETCQISLTEDFLIDRITANVTWPGAGSGSSDIDVDVTLDESSVLADERRVGVGVYGRYPANIDIGSGAAFRTFTRVQTERFDFTDPSTESSISRTDAGSNRYFIPDGYTAAYLDRGASAPNALFTTSGPFDSNSEPADGEPSIDTQQDSFTGGDVAVNSDFALFFREDVADGPFEPEVSLRDSMTESNDNFDLTLGIRFDATFENGITAHIVGSDGQAYNTTGLGSLSTIRFHKYANGDFDSTYSTSNHTFPVHRDSTVRLVDEDDTLKIVVDGNELIPQQGTSDFSGQLYSGAGGNENDSWIDAIRWKTPRSSVGTTDNLAKVSSAKLLVAAGGTVVGIENDQIVSVTDGSGALTPDVFNVQMQSAYNRTFMLDGQVSKVYNLSTNAVTTWTADEGTLPSQCRLIALYRGRLVLSGRHQDPHNWFMSKVGDVFDWDYSPANTTPIQAVAGNNSDAGLVGDIITALIPYSDDILIFGGDHTIWQMTGDPAAGGTIDLVSDRTGMAFGRAWTKDPSGTLYFWGQDGIYRMLPGSEGPQNMTRGIIDERVQGVDLEKNRIYMEWDPERAALYALIVSGDASESTRMIVWESRADAWWEDEYPAAHGPNQLFMFDSAAAEDRAFLMGGRDGFIRQIDDDATDDDGTQIESRVRFAPLLAENQEVVMNTVFPVLASGSGTPDLKVYTGQTAEECVGATTPKVARTLARAGRNAQMRQKVRGYAVQFELDHTGSERWALESLKAAFQQGGVPRREAR